MSRGPKLRDAASQVALWAVVRGLEPQNLATTLVCGRGDQEWYFVGRRFSYEFWWGIPCQMP